MPAFTICRKAVAFRKDRCPHRDELRIWRPAATEIGLLAKRDAMPTMIHRVLLYSWRLLEKELTLIHIVHELIVRPQAGLEAETMLVLEELGGTFAREPGYVEGWTRRRRSPLPHQRVG